MPTVTIEEYSFEYYYNKYANRHFVDVKKSGECVLSGFALTPGQWPIANGIIASVSYKRVPDGFSNDHSNADIEFYRAYPITTDGGDDSCWC